MLHKDNKQTTTTVDETITRQDATTKDEAANAPKEAKKVDTQQPPKSPTGNFSLAPDGSDAEANKAAQRHGVPLPGTNQQPATAGNDKRQ